MGIMDKIGAYADAVIDYVRAKTEYIIYHAIAALAVWVFLVWRGAPSAVAAFSATLCLIFWEIGQNKYEIPGSVQEASKRLQMLRRIFVPSKVAQWLVPSLPPYLLALFF